MPTGLVNWINVYIRFRKQRQPQRSLTRKRQGCSNQIPKRQADLQLGSKSVNLRKYAEPNLIIFSSILGIPTHAVILCARGRNLSVILGIKRSVTRNLSLPKLDLMRSFDAPRLRVRVFEGYNFEITHMDSYQAIENGLPEFVEH